MTDCRDQARLQLKALRMKIILQQTDERKLMERLHSQLCYRECVCVLRTEECSDGRLLLPQLLDQIKLQIHLLWASSKYVFLQPVAAL